MKLILASASPRRRELLASVRLTFEVEASSVEELQRHGEAPETYVRRLAEDKAREVASRHPDAWVIAADTIVFIDGAILEKPRDHEDAVRMLSRIAGRVHEVFTGLTLTNGAADRSYTTVVTTRVKMLNLSPDEIEWYASTGEPMDKAGAYAVQGIGAMFIQSIDGSYTNVVGLPLAELFEMMKTAGLRVKGEE
ncbi:MAG TPA: Maf family protein [Thermoanaerobaculia bacterium]|nr:Maf family protein [Thermoanaerobaculia bacterium]